MLNSKIQVSEVSIAIEVVGGNLNLVENKNREEKLRTVTILTEIGVDDDSSLENNEVKNSVFHVFQLFDKMSEPENAYFDALYPPVKMASEPIGSFFKTQGELVILPWDPRGQYGIEKNLQVLQLSYLECHESTDVWLLQLETKASRCDKLCLCVKIPKRIAIFQAEFSEFLLQLESCAFRVFDPGGVYVLLKYRCGTERCYLPKFPIHWDLGGDLIMQYGCCIFVDWRSLSGIALDHTRKGTIGNIGDASSSSSPPTIATDVSIKELESIMERKMANLVVKVFQRGGICYSNSPISLVTDLYQRAK